ncbi:MAG: hypothetical protein JNL39_15210, partial [Opitutaceae bacterium]|nr:hypothetical protein [Opitutaceae bacterium]
MTLVLVAFLVLLLVGLATYARIETTIAGNQQRQAQARENALLALQVALGQLQKHAGPDQRATATGEATGNAGAKHLVGVWDSTTPGSGPLTWLVSGSERAGATPDEVLAAALDPSSNATADQEFLVGSRTVSANADRIKVAKQDITAVGVPGQAGAVRVGRYAWWVGDQGVKAPVAVADNTDAITFAPYDSAEMRSRIRQQITVGAGAADTAGSPIFEPRDANNAPLVANEKISTVSQLAFLRTTASGAPQLGLTRVQQNFHTWSPNNFAVLADTKNGGLRQDLSLAPGLLGNAFSAWANFSGYTEPLTTTTTTSTETGTVTTTTPTEGILPPYGTEPLRRRVVMTPHQLDANASHQIAPILSYFLLTFNVRTESPNGTAPSGVEVRARWMISLWNPYTASIVPENLRIEVTGLPNSVQIVNEETDRAGNVGAPFSLRSAFGDPSKSGNPLNVSLPWDTATLPAETPAEDRKSWLPGRVYTWCSEENTDKS